jgi:hypothetical protein
VSASLVSGYYYIVVKNEALSKIIDRATRTTVFVAYVISNVVIPMTAYSAR